MNRLARVAAFVFALSSTLLFSPHAAQAHDAVLGFSGYPVLILHPFIVLDHAICLLAAGLFSGQQHGFSPLRILAMLVLGLAGGFACLVLLPGFPLEKLLPLIGAVLIGGLAALAPQLHRWAGAGVVAASGFVVGLNTYPESSLAFVLAMTLGGLVIGAAILVIVPAWAVARLTRHWQHIGVRIAASWIAASAFLVLVLVLAS